MPTEELFLADNVSYTEAIDILQTNNLTEVEINTMIYGILGESLGKTKRVFSYGKTFADDAPGCVSTFARGFAHVDWIDGESVVQAEENSIEEGFNLRFHKIEADTDALARNLVKAFDCVADMRKELANRLSELRSEINRINADVYECCDKDSGGGWVYQNPGTIYKPIYEAWKPPIFAGPGKDPYPIGPLSNWVAGNPGWADTTPWTNIGSLSESLEATGKLTYPGPSVTRSANDPSRATVAGMPARRLDIKDFNGQTYEVWSTGSGLVMTPAEAGLKAQDQSERSWTSQRSKLVGDVAEWMTDKAGALAEVFAAGTTVGAVAEKFGDDRLDGGVRVRDALSVLPGSTKIERPADLLNLVAERAAITVTRDGLATETLVANIGFNEGFRSVGEVAITDFKAIPLDARKVIADAGIRTVGDLQNANPARLAQILSDKGIATGAQTVARWSGEALVVDKLAGLAR